MKKTDSDYPRARELLRRERVLVGKNHKWVILDYAQMGRETEVLIYGHVSKPVTTNDYYTVAVRLAVYTRDMMITSIILESVSRKGNMPRGRKASRRG
jgi:hypothetical protein